MNAYVAIHNSKRYTIAHAEKAVASLVTAMDCKRRDQVCDMKFCTANVVCHTSPPMIGFPAQIALEEWMTWGRNNPEDPLLLTIVYGMKDAFVSDALNTYLETKLDPTAKRRHLAGSSLFTEAEVALVQVHLCRGCVFVTMRGCEMYQLPPRQAAYNHMKIESPSGVVDFDAVQSVFGRFLPASVIQRMFKRWDAGSVGAVNCDAMLMTLSICCNGSVDEKAKLAFELYDPELSGILSPDAVRDNEFLFCCLH